MLLQVRDLCQEIQHPHPLGSWLRRPVEPHLAVLAVNGLHQGPGAEGAEGAEVDASGFWLGMIVFQGSDQAVRRHKAPGHLESSVVAVALSPNPQSWSERPGQGLRKCMTASSPLSCRLHHASARARSKDSVGQVLALAGSKDGLTQTSKSN